MNTDLRSLLQTMSSVSAAQVAQTPSESASRKPQAVTNKTEAREAVDRYDCMDIKFWTRDDWMAHVKLTEDTTGVAPPKLDFLEDDNGKTVSKERRREMTRVAISAWSSLYTRRLDPESWSKKLPAARDYYYDQMTRNFDELRLCDGGKWKAEQFAIHQFPNWVRDTRNKGKLRSA